MSTARGHANHRLYLARILLSAWLRDRESAVVPSQVLQQAYLAAVRDHLISAYGWFLWEVSGSKDLPAQAPRSCEELPAPPAGKAEAGEIREFRQLEARGWLAEMLRPVDGLAMTSVRSRDNLAVGSPDFPDVSRVAVWADQLSALFDRMSDSLDEY